MSVRSWRLKLVQDSGCHGKRWEASGRRQDAIPAGNTGVPARKGKD